MCVVGGEARGVRACAKGDAPISCPWSCIRLTSWMLGTSAMNDRLCISSSFGLLIASRIASLHPAYVSINAITSVLSTCNASHSSFKACPSGSSTSPGAAEEREGRVGREASRVGCYV
jgi:hypothetical protein